MRIGYFTDTHIRTDTPEGRLDNYQLAIYSKLIETGKIFNERKVDLVLCGGDIFDQPDVAQSLLYDTIGILKDWKLPIVSTIGSHDHFGYQIKTLKRTAIGILKQSGVLTILDKENSELKNDEGVCILPSKYNIMTEDDIRIQIVSTPHTYYLSEDPANYYKKKEEDVDFLIQLTHGDLLQRSAPWQHVKISDITTEANIVLGAHYHPGWSEVVRIINGNGTWFLHPGSLGRLEYTKNMPKILIIDIIPGINVYNFTFEYVYLSSAILDPFKERIGNIESEEIPQQDIEVLLNMIDNTKITTVDIKDQLPGIAKKLNYSQEVLEKAFEYLDYKKK